MILMKSWTVFKQDTPKKPHQMVGSVYAVDGETALLAARSVFARRPKAVSLWVAPTDQIETLSHEVVERIQDSLLTTVGEMQTWQVFRKSNQRRAMTFVEHIGEVTTINTTAAVYQLYAELDDGKPTWVLMFVPDSAIVRSEADDIESWFKPALTKTYKQQSQYGFVGGTRAKKKK